MEHKCGEKLLAFPFGKVGNWYIIYRPKIYFVIYLFKLFYFLTKLSFTFKGLSKKHTCTMYMG